MARRADNTTDEVVTASIMVIGDEILSGRTKDTNIGYIAEYLTAIGIDLREVRVVADEDDAIIEAVNALRRTYDYVFTTGGIGPTHDDITADSIARAFGVPIDTDERAMAILRERYAPERLTETRMRMARVPQGAELIMNSVSGAPGFMIENVIVMAGVPRIMQVMLDDVAPRLRTGRKMRTRTVRVERPEGDVAEALARVQANFPDVRMGSYPFMDNNRLGTHLVLRATDEPALETAYTALWAMLDETGLADAARDADPTATTGEGRR